MHILTPDRKGVHLLEQLLYNIYDKSATLKNFRLKDILSYGYDIKSRGDEKIDLDYQYDAIHSQPKSNIDYLIFKILDVKKKRYLMNLINLKRNFSKGGYLSQNFFQDCVSIMKMGIS